MLTELQSFKELQRENRVNPHDWMIHGRLATELLAANNSGMLYIVIIKL